MALQAIDRKNTKHIMKVAPRKAPALVNRSNKQTFAELAPLHQKTANRLYSMAFRNIYGRDYDWN